VEVAKLLPSSEQKIHRRRFFGGHEKNSVQHATGEPYISRSSDPDLLWRADDTDRPRRGIQLLQPWQASNALRLDGEVLLPGNHAVAWRELATRPRRGLVKSAADTSLWPLQRCLDLLGSTPP